MEEVTNTPVKVDSSGQLDQLDRERINAALAPFGVECGELDPATAKLDIKPSHPTR